MKLLYAIIFVVTINFHLGYSKWKLVDYFKVPYEATKVLMNDRKYTLFYKDDKNIFHIMEEGEPDIATSKSNKWPINTVCDYQGDYIIGRVHDLFFFSKKNLELTKVDKLKALALNVKKIDTNLYYYTANASLCWDGTHHSIISKYDTNKVDVVKFAKYPENIQLTLFGPRKLISISSDQVVITDITKYRFNIFDLNGNYIRNYSKDDKNWKPFYGKLTEDYCNKNYVSILMKNGHYIDECSQIWLNNFLDDSTLLITWGTPNKKSKKEVIYSYYHDIWKEVGGSWKYKETIHQKLNTELRTLDINSISLENTYSVSNGYLYIIKPFPIDLVKKHYGKSYSEFENEMNNFYINNDLQYTCFIYKYVP